MEVDELPVVESGNSKIRDLFSKKYLYYTIFVSVAKEKKVRRIPRAIKFDTAAKIIRETAAPPKPITWANQQAWKWMNFPLWCLK